MFKNYQNYTTIGTLRTKLNQFLVDKVREKIPEIREKLKAIKNEKLKEKESFGLAMNLNVSNDSKGALLVSIINKYTRYYTETLKGERFINNELSGAARINTVIEVFKNELMEMEAFEDMNDLDLHISMTNYKGLNTGLIISDKAFTKLIKKAIDRLLAPCLECLNKI